MDKKTEFFFLTISLHSYQLKMHQIVNCDRDWQFSRTRTVEQDQQLWMLHVRWHSVKLESYV